MPEFTDPHSGEVSTIPDADLARYEPVGPIELEQFIRALGDRLEDAVPVIKELWRRRYAAERAFIEGKAKALMRSDEETVAMKRAEADLATMPLKHAFDDAKEILHAAEELQKALHSKLMGYMNLNKAQAAAFSAGGVGR